MESALVPDTQSWVLHLIALMATILIIPTRARPTDIMGPTGSWAEFLSARVRGSMAGTDSVGTERAITDAGSTADAIIDTAGDMRTGVDTVIANISMGSAKITATGLTEATAGTRTGVDMAADSMVAAAFTEAVVFTADTDRRAA